MSQGSPPFKPPRTPVPYRVAARIIRFVLVLSTKVKWRGQENLPTDSGFVVASNHLSNFDPLTLMHYLYASGFPPRMLAKKSLFKIFGLGWLMAASGMIPVERNSANAVNSLDPSIAAIRAGHCVAVFPEGTLSKDPELWPMRGKTGAVRLALESGRPLIPVGQWGAHNVMPRKTKIPKLFRRIPVTVQAGTPVDLSDLTFDPHSPDVETLRIATERTMTAITNIVAELRGEEPPAHVWTPVAEGDNSPTTSPHGKDANYPQENS